MHNQKAICNDAGSVHCPCVLAACDACMTCSRLAGYDFCNCDWRGVCIYNEYILNGERAAKRRNSGIYEIQKKIWYENDLAVMRVKVPKGFAESASLPGSYVFVRNVDDEDVFDMPVSVMSADYETGGIDMVVKATGPKSKRILETEGELAVRGVYSNGLICAEKLRTPGRKKVLCMTKGAAFSPVVNYCRWAAGRDEISVVADLDKVSKRLIEDCFTGCKIRNMAYMNLPVSAAEVPVDDYDVIVLCASDHYQEHIVLPENKKVLSNNFTMCCGDGICGACIYTDKNGNSYRMCKCREK